MIFLTASSYAALCAPIGPWDAPHLKALGMIESAERDGAIGKKGEVSRYQISKAVWLECGGKDTYDVYHWKDHRYASQIAYTHMCRLFKELKVALGRVPTNVELYITYNAGLEYMKRRQFNVWRCSARLRDREMRYDNLVMMYNGMN